MHISTSISRFMCAPGKSSRLFRVVLSSAMFLTGFNVDYGIRRSGQTQGSFAVTQTGEAVYQIPIAVSSGTQGFTTESIPHIR